MSEPVPQVEQPTAEQPAVEQEPVVQPAQPANTGPTEVAVRFTHDPTTMIPTDYTQVHDDVWFPNGIAVTVPADLAARLLEKPGFTLADPAKLAPARQP